MKFIKQFMVSILAFIYLTLEYIFWNNILEPIYLKLKSLRLYQKTLKWIKSQHKYIILFIFILFFVSSEILGILAFAFLADGLVSLFLLIYVIKFLPVAIAFTVLENSKNELLTIKWFSIVYNYTLKLIHLIQENSLLIKSKVIFEKLRTKVQAIIENINLTLKSL